MKKILTILMGCLILSACNNGEIERLQKENESLKAQITELRQNQVPNHSTKIPPQMGTDIIVKTKAQQIVKDYLLSETAKERSSFVIDPKEELPRMEKMYKDGNVSWKNRHFSFMEDRKLGDYVLVSIKQNNNTSSYFLKNLKIDWSTSQLFNNHSPLLDNIKKMKLDIDSKKHHLLTMITSLSGVYPFNGLARDLYDLSREQIYVFQMNDGSETSNTFSICQRKNSDCQKLFEQIKENDFCIISSEAWYPKKLAENPEKWQNINVLPIQIYDIQVKVCW